jgi:amino-acid N-acetyltransferase
MNDFSCRTAEPEDAEEMKRLLRECRLPPGGIDPHLANFIVAKNEDGLAGIVGIEVYDSCGLLRSFAVDGALRGKGLGSELYRLALERAKELGLKSLFLLTTSASGYFSKRGWTNVDRRRVPYALNASIEFRGACPVTAVCMKLDLGQAG